MNPTAMSTEKVTSASQDLMRSLGDYPVRQQDDESKFFGKRVIYLCWEKPKATTAAQ